MRSRHNMLRSIAILAAFTSATCLELGRQVVIPHQRASLMAARAHAMPIMRTPQPIDEGVLWFNKLVVDTVYNFVCLVYPKNDLAKHSLQECTARFFVLETVARVPYFAYLSVMHLKESLGDRKPGANNRMRTHYAEADNELHHLLIMEALGGNSSAVDRALARTMACAYYCEPPSCRLPKQSLPQLTMRGSTLLTAMHRRVRRMCLLVR